jgi:hypothetical protein
MQTGSHQLVGSSILKLHFEVEPNGIESTGILGNPYGFSSFLVFGARSAASSVAPALFLSFPALVHQDFNSKVVLFSTCPRIGISNHAFITGCAGLNQILDPAFTSRSRNPPNRSYALPHCHDGHQPKTRSRYHELGRFMEEGTRKETL